MASETLQLSMASPSSPTSEAPTLTPAQQQAISLIQNRVAQYYEVPLATLLGRSRVSSVAWARAMAMYLTVAKLPQLSLGRIGNAFGKNSHATVLHARNKITAAMESDPAVSRDVAHLSQNVINGSVQAIMSASETVLVVPWRKRAALSDKLESLPASAPAPKALTLQAIQSKVAEDFGFTVSDLIGASRKVPLVTARFTALYLAKKLTRETTPVIGQAFGGRDHASVLHAIQRVKTWMTDDPDLRDYIAGFADNFGKSTPVNSPSCEPSEEAFATPI